LFQNSWKKPDNVHELDCIEQALSYSLQPCKNPASETEWATFGFFLGFELFKRIRPWRLRIGDLPFETKSDGSPATQLEAEIESFVRQSLQTFFPEAGFQGEETGSTSAHHPLLLVIDPIDGTRSFLAGFDTYSVTIGVLKEQQSIFSLICNPATGDFAFRIAGGSSRVFQYPLFSEAINPVDLPFLPAFQQKDAPILVNLHPSKKATLPINRLYTLWNQGAIALVKSVSGSPSLQILEAARGGCIYFNTWFEDQTMPYDLAVAADILRGANGQMLDWQGDPIDPWKHKGPFWAGIHQDHLLHLIEALAAL
jgi:myo-inositol-1(or 4)-monophosphatase